MKLNLCYLHIRRFFLNFVYIDRKLNRRLELGHVDNETTFSGLQDSSSLNYWRHPGHLYTGMPLSRSLIHWNASIPVKYPLECLYPGHLYTGMPLSRSNIHWNASIPVNYPLECLYPGQISIGMPLSRSPISQNKKK
jgi:hypothetical protein